MTMGERPSRSIIDLETAIALNSELFSEMQKQFRAWTDRIERAVASYNGQQAAPGRKLVAAASNAAEIAVAMFSTRYGVGAKVGVTGFAGHTCLEYHNTQHALDIIARLDQLYDHFGLEVFPPRRRVLLALFAAFHDLRQFETGAPLNGIGANERRTAIEAREILLAALTSAGFDLNDEEDETCDYLIGDMELMIHGTTFNFGSRTEQITNPFDGKAREQTIPTGAIAPLIIEQLKLAFPDWLERPQLRETMENILLAADVDTANVSDAFFEFATQGVNLCREIEKRKGNLEPESRAVYGFMTSGQEYYFHVAQKYNTRFTKELFSARKEANSKKLAALTKHMRENFGNQADNYKSFDPKNTTAGPELLDEYLNAAQRIDREG